MGIVWKGASAVLGGFIIHFTLGTVYTFGNMNPYITSYMRFYSASPDITYTQSTWIFSLALCGQGIAMALGGLMERKIGARFTALIGGWFMSLGVLLTSVTVKSSFAVIILTYGVMFGIGTGIAYGVAIAAAMRWFPARKGLVGGIVAAGFGGGSLVFNQLQTYYINPDNVKANLTIDGDNYFDQPEILDRVPSCFTILGVTYAAMQLLGSLALFPAVAAASSSSAAAAEEAEAERPLISPVPRGSRDNAAATKSPASPAAPEEATVSPRQLVRTPHFWLLWLTFLVNTQSVVYISSQYKAYGLYRHFDDHFLAVAGSVSSVFNAGTRVVWGLLHDLLGYWPPMLMLTAGAALLMATFYLNSGAAFYFAYVCLLFAVNAGNFALFPAVCAKLFGARYFSVNYGLVFTGNAVSAIVGAIVTAPIKESFGWLGLFVTGAVFSVVGGLLTILFLIVTRMRRASFQDQYTQLDNQG